MKKALIYDPYLETLGGGERYVFTFVEYLLSNDYEVDVVWSNADIKEKLISRLNLKIEKINFVTLPENAWEKNNYLKKYDLCFWLSDGSIPFFE